MDKKTAKVVIKYTTIGLFAAIVFLGIGLLISANTDNNLKDILFIESLIILFGIIFASVSGPSLGISVQGLGNPCIQNPDVSHIEHGRSNDEEEDVTTTITLSTTTFTLFICAFILILFNFFI